MLVLATRPGGKESDNRHDRLLPPRTQRPCRRRTAHERDEFASFHSIELHPIPHKPGPGATGYRIDDDQSAGVRMILHTECRAAPKLRLGLSPVLLNQQTLTSMFWTPLVCRYCCKSPKIPDGDFFERNEANLCSPINMVPRPLAKLPVSLSRGDEVPHVFIGESHQRARKIFISSGKRLLQQNLPGPDSCSAAKSTFIRSPRRRGRTAGAKPRPGGNLACVTNLEAVANAGNADA